MRLSLLALAAALLAPLAGAQVTVTFRFLPDLTAPAPPIVVRAFVPGSMNGWGPNSNGNIAPNAPSQAAYVPALNEYRYTVALAPGGQGVPSDPPGAYTYKVHYHTTAVPPSYGGTWIADPLGTETAGQNNDSVVRVADPMAFQLAREQNAAGEVAAVSVGLFGTQAFTNVTFTVNATVYTTGIADTGQGIFRLELPAAVPPGSFFRVDATDAGGRTVTAEVGVVPPTVVDAPVPAGMRDGITLNPADPTRATLVLRAPGKSYVHAIGDFSDWQPLPAYVLRRDAADPLGTRWWTELTGLTPGQPVRFQYLVDGVIRVSDPYAALVLHPNDDAFVPTVTFPNRPPYPAGETDFYVSVFTPGAAPFPWTDGGFVRPGLDGALIYEMLVRDFVQRHDFQTVRDTLAYFQRLGVTALELMPVAEFDGNESWGYNPNHYFAVDKYYGSPEALKNLVDAAHALGMAVVLDVVYNHQTGQAPFVRLYNEGEFGAPTPDNPWVNPVARHPFNVFNDNNHASAATQYWLDAANRWWIEEYHIDGFRFDLSKGFTQTNTGGNVGAWGQYDQSRIDNLTRMADAIWSADPSAYVILEHFADASEERVLANHGRAEGRPGMTLWNNMTGAYSESAMGYLNANSDLRRAYAPNNNYPLTGQVAYMESHDEQWMMYKARTFGACSGAPGGGPACTTNPGDYTTRALPTALERQALAAAFFLTVPGPKMLWQFGELGYGGGPGECLADDCPAGTPGRVANKPIRWDYYAAVPPFANGSGLTLPPASDAERAQRRALYDAFANLGRLRQGYAVFQTPATVQFQTGAGIADRWIRLEKDGLEVVVVGNFGLTERTSTPPLAVGQTWYDMIVDGSVAGGAAVTLAPGAWRVYANQDLGVPPVADEDAPDGGAAFRLSAPFPNPSAGPITVAFSLPTAGDVRLDAFDVLGRRVATLADGAHAAGAHRATFDPRGLPAGVYVLRLSASGQTATARLTVTR